MNIVCFHLFNDYSGSPKVLHDVISGLLTQGYNVELVTSAGGVLDTLSHKRFKIRHYNYKFSDSTFIEMLRYSGAQLCTFLMAFRYVFKKDTTFYINTILPVGPAIAGKLTGKKVIYHYHENAFIKSAFYRGLAKLMQKLADRIICVSEYQASFLKRKDGVTVIPNTLAPELVGKLKPDPEDAFERKNVLMLSSLKEYKGTKEFIKLGALLPDFKFTLVINDSMQAIERWIETLAEKPTDNIAILPRMENVDELYNSASLVVNMSNPDLFVETFGLTALEAMSCALPVIVPPVGGIAEMVTDGVNGFKIDCRDTERITDTIKKIFSDKSLYKNLAENAYSYSRRFDRENMIISLSSFFNI